MSVQRGSRESNGQTPIRPRSGATPQAATPVPSRSSATRVGASWGARTAAQVLTLLLLVFLAQNTDGTEISFLWMTTDMPLSVALLIGAAGSALIMLILGLSRITRLRGLIRNWRD